MQRFKFGMTGLYCFRQDVNCKIRPWPDGEVNEFEVMLDGTNCFYYSTSGLFAVDIGHPEVKQVFYLHPGKSKTITVNSAWLGDEMSVDLDGTISIPYPDGNPVEVILKHAEVYLIVLDLLHDRRDISAKDLAYALSDKLDNLTKCSVDFVGSEACCDILAMYNDGMAQRRRQEREYNMVRSVAEQLRALIMPTTGAGENELPTYLSAVLASQDAPVQLCGTYLCHEVRSCLRRIGEWDPNYGIPEGALTTVKPGRRRCS